MYQRMLVPLDGSKLSEVVFPYAKELAGRLGLEVVLLHVHSPGESETVPLHRAYIEHKAEMIRRQSQEVQTKVGVGEVGRAVQVRGELAVGYPADEILRYAEENDVDLILMATHGRSGIRRWVMGSVADRVLRASKVPVWLVRAGIPEGIVYDKWPKRTILVPLDGSGLAEEVLPHVEALAKQHGTELLEVVLLRVYEPVSALGYYPPSARFETPSGAVHVMPRDYARGERARQKIITEQYLAGVSQRLNGAGLNKVRFEALAGTPAEVIVDYANNHPFNLIVMSTHARSGLSRWAYGSVAARVLHGVSSPIFLVRAGATKTAELRSP
ncbi:MAG TPA: universal stress protein [Dehalococcoidia bacterium]|nr:universal stress protein [Dehalococcoidia bacterium]